MGENDESAGESPGPAGNAALIADLLPDSWLTRFPGAGHAVMAQEAGRLSRLINLFFDRT
ncbi:MAG: hypothetical protein JJE13_01460 [Thermoleophilia bacterium]|nr:hypothetical protein [Thermoleophilia bacterium]